MSSILTNTGAMVALQTMRGINKNMAQTQSEISTGKSINSAKDNAAVWAISKTMQADVKGFSAISDSLALGRSTVAVGAQAAETVTDLLTQMKGAIVSAQEENVDRVKIQTDIVALREQITSITTAAQFNGLNLLSNRDATAGSGTVNVLSSLDRASDGSVASANIDVAKQDLGTNATDWTAGTADAAGSGSNISGALDAAAVVALTGAATPPTTAVVIDSVEAGMGVQINISAAAGSVGAAFNDATRDVSYVARDGDTQADMARGLADAFNARVASAIEAGTLDANSSLSAAVTVATNGVATVTFTGETGAGNNVSLQAIQTNDVEIGGRLEALNDIDVSTAAGASSALADIEGLIQTAIDSAAAFGSAQTRIDTQAEFIKNLSDALTTGIGSLVDADMEAASARLQALQVQQQLATQSLSIANQQPQNILALFR
ncbi:flagellin N-terminal helical domain-containing protein [Roseinatronobacter sp. NSM]|uniref:flagellin N-terminal helical domain-containing protein n=1 Tax=Roseinatronobacter sp. NSM TaxID=3457785 RepID=UPI004036BD09